MDSSRPPTPIQSDWRGRSRLIPTRAELRASADLVSVALLAVAAAVLAVTLPKGSLPRTMLAAPLVLALPGYALLAAAFAFATLGAVERLVLSVGASLAIAVLGGFVLNWLPWGLQAATWAGLLAGITVVAAIGGLACRRVARAGAAPDSGGERPLARLGIGQAAAFGLAALVLVAALGLSRSGALAQHQRGFTQLWALPGDGAADRIRIGVECQESAPVAYLLRLEIGGSVLQEWAPLQLAPGERWEAAGVALPPPGQPGATAVQAVLYRLDAPDTVYRRVTVWQ